MQILQESLCDLWICKYKWVADATHALASTKPRNDSKKRGGGGIAFDIYKILFWIESPYFLLQEFALALIVEIYKRRILIAILLFKD